MGDDFFFINLLCQFLKCHYESSKSNSRPSWRPGSGMGEVFAGEEERGRGIAWMLPDY